LRVEQRQTADGGARKRRRISAWTNIAKIAPEAAAAAAAWRRQRGGSGCAQHQRKTKWRKRRKMASSFEKQQRQLYVANGISENGAKMSGDGALLLAASAMGWRRRQSKR